MASNCCDKQDDDDAGRGRLGVTATPPVRTDCLDTGPEVQRLDGAEN